MLWYQNPVLRAALQSSFKVSNQRIVSLAKKYGKNSYVYKKETSFLQKDMFKPFTATSKSGYPKLDVRSINKSILSGKVDRSEVNQFLSQAAGIRIDADGNIKKLPEQGIATITQIRERAKKRAERLGEPVKEWNVQDLDDFAELLEEFSANFETEYEHAVAEYGEQALRDDPVTQQLYGEHRHGRKLTYNQMTDIMKAFKAMGESQTNQALTFEKNNTEDV